MPPPRLFPLCSALEDALKIRQLLGEFDFEGGGNRARIVGFREFVFTHDVSSIANFFSLQVGGACQIASGSGTPVALVIHCPGSFVIDGPRSSVVATPPRADPALHLPPGSSSDIS